MFQLFGMIVVLVLALYAAANFGWLTPEVAAKLPDAHEISEILAPRTDEPASTDENPFSDLAPGEKTFTERVTGEPNPNRTD